MERAAVNPMRDVIGVYCDDTSHWRRRRSVGFFTRRAEGRWESTTTGATIDMDFIDTEGDVEAAPKVSGGVYPLRRRRRFRLWCPWCGKRSVVVIRGEKLDPILDDLRNTPGFGIPLAWLAANVRSTGE
jgi:hypothetical protein